MAAARKIQVTKDYRLFHRHEGENRPLNIKKHKKLKDSMSLYGFLSCFPIVCVRGEDGRLIIKDGQHRHMIAESLGLPVYWIEEEVDFDVAVVNCTAKIWALRDYAQKHAVNGLSSYGEGLEFAAQHGLPIGTAFALLAGTTTFSNCTDQFIDGTFTIKDRKWADAVAGIYGPVTTMSAQVKNQRFIEACMAVCRVKEFNQKRLLANAERCREKLASYSTRDAYLDMLETIYNFGRKDLVGLKALATMAMRERNAAKPKRKAAATDEPIANGQPVAAATGA